MNKQTQKQKILQWFLTKGEMTVRDAIIELGINSPPKRIEELRKEGYLISMTWKQSGNGSRYGVYRLEA